MKTHSKVDLLTGDDTAIQLIPLSATECLRIYITDRHSEPIDTPWITKKDFDYLALTLKKLWNTYTLRIGEKIEIQNEVYTLTEVIYRTYVNDPVTIIELSISPF